ncbi:MAG: hypothetical protein A3E87_06350 [Gammaproteobacteria bacterium RIFCSPHIGHO2_12_FULL_35_23]|nr:MAG: hypothetical protein A3E87_06350 [Gammaproteobacteria bacterium RIFCSPHIGHO2_12_FULL_35_23]
MIITVQPIILGPHTLPAIEINIDTATYSYFSSYMARPKPITTLAELKSIYLKALNAKYILLEDGDTIDFLSIKVRISTTSVISVSVEVEGGAAAREERKVTIEEREIEVEELVSYLNDRTIRPENSEVIITGKIIPAPSGFYLYLDAVKHIELLRNEATEVKRFLEERAAREAAEQARRAAAERAAREAAEQARRAAAERAAREAAEQARRAAAERAAREAAEQAKTRRQARPSLLLSPVARELELTTLYEKASRQALPAAPISVETGIGVRAAALGLPATRFLPPVHVLRRYVEAGSGSSEGSPVEEAGTGTGAGDTRSRDDRTGVPIYQPRLGRRIGLFPAAVETGSAAAKAGDRGQADIRLPSIGQSATGRSSDRRRRTHP